MLTRPTNGNKLIKIKYKHVIVLLSRLAGYERVDRALSWLYTGSRKTDDSSSDVNSSAVKPISTPSFVRDLFFK